jgi:hypothetical protein
LREWRRGTPTSSARQRVTRDIDNRRILWAAEDIIRNRPALSRWHPDYKDEFAEFLTLDAPFRR